MSLTVETRSPFEDLARLYDADPAFVAPRLLSRAGDLSNSNLSAALSFYEFLAEREPHSYYGAIARKKIEDITGSQGLTFGRFAFLSNEALKSLGDYRISVPWLLGGLAFPIGRAFAGKKWWGTLTGLGLEVPTVTLSTHGLFKLSGADAPGNLGDDMLRFGLVASLFRVTSPLGIGAFRLTHGVNPVTQLPGRFIAQAPWTRPFFQYGTQYSALVTAHSIEAKTKLVPSVPGSNLWAESFVSLVEMNLAGRATGGITEPFNRRLLTRSHFSKKGWPWNFRLPSVPRPAHLRPAYAGVFLPEPFRRPTVMAMAAGEGGGRGLSVRRLRPNRKAALAMLLRTDSHPRIKSVGTDDNTTNIRERLLKQITEVELTAVEALSGRARSRELARLLFKYNPTPELMGTLTTPGDSDGYTALLNLLIDFHLPLYNKRLYLGPAILSQTPEVELKAYRKTKMELDAVWRQDWLQLYTEWEGVVRTELARQFIHENPRQTNNTTARDQFVRNRLHRIYLHALALKFMDDHPQLLASLPRPQQTRLTACDLDLCQWVAQTADLVDYSNPLVNRLGRGMDLMAEETSEAFRLEAKREAVSSTLVRILFYTDHLSQGAVPDGKALHLARQNYHYYARNMGLLPAAGRIRRPDLRDCDPRAFVKQERESQVFAGNDPLLYRTLEIARHIHRGDLTPYPASKHQLNWFMASTLGSTPELPYVHWMVKHHPHVLAVLERPDGTKAAHFMVDRFQAKETKAWLNYNLSTLAEREAWTPLETRAAYGLCDLLQRTPSFQKMPSAPAWRKFRAIFEVDLQTPAALTKTLERLDAIRGYIQKRSEPVETEVTAEIDDLETKTLQTLAPTYSKLGGRRLLSPPQLQAYQRNLVGLDVAFQGLEKDLLALDRRIEAKLLAANPELQAPILDEATRGQRQARMAEAHATLDFYETLIHKNQSPEISVQHRQSLSDAIHETRGLLREFEEGSLENEALLRLAEAELPKIDTRIQRRLERSELARPEDAAPSADEGASPIPWAELSATGKVAQLREEGVVFYIARSQNSCHALDFLEGLEPPNQNKILRMAHLLATREVNLTKDRFRKINDTGAVDLYEIRDPGTAGLRVFVTLHEGRWYLLNGYFKRAQAINAQEFSRAIRLAKEINSPGNHPELEAKQRFITIRLWQDLSKQATALKPQLEGLPEFAELFAQLQGPFESHHLTNADLVTLDARLNQMQP
ncbi:MAG: hypothetical protein HYU97_04925 [Deltaproteobacteria bacterium]|nr:hypothetical protein [Deltaproteobacteria bacterium]